MKFPKNIAPGRQSLEKEFRESGLALSPKEAGQFWQLHELLSQRNPEGDLTRVKGFYNLIYKHYIDGAMVAEFIEPEGLTMDLGTGAGFPGLPLAIRRPAWPLLLAEPRSRRLAFMEEAAALLGLNNVEFYPHKVGPRFDRPINNFITRDFEPAPDSLRRAEMIIPPGGRVYLMKGPKVDAELSEAEALPQWADFELENDRAYSLGASGLKRRLIVWRKKDKASRPAAPPPYRVVEIASKENPRYKSWLKSLSGKGLKKNGQALIFGRKFIAEILKDGSAEQYSGLIARRLSDLDGLAVPPGLPIHLLRPELWPELDIYGSGPPLLILEIPDLPAWSGHLAEGLTVFLPFQDPANLGTAIRTATALGSKVVVLKEAASPWHPKSLRASGPSILSADLAAGPSLAELAGMNLPGLFALSPRGSDLLSARLPGQCGFVFGIEGPGLPEAWPKERRYSIAMSSKVESLNAAAALAVALGIWKSKSYCQA